MKITFLTVGKTEDAYLKDGIDKYVKRLKHYTKLELVDLPELKNTKALTEQQQKTKEAELILKKITPLDHVILLDEKPLSCVAVSTAAVPSASRFLPAVLPAPLGRYSTIHDLKPDGITRRPNPGRSAS